MRECDSVEQTTAQRRETGSISAQIDPRSGANQDRAGPRRPRKGCGGAALRCHGFVWTLKPIGELEGIVP